VLDSETNQAPEGTKQPDDPLEHSEFDTLDEVRTGTTSHEFKAETRKLLDIVAKSLYTDSHVFIRELLSNASDALEKQKYQQLTGNDLSEGDPLQVSVITNEAKRQIIIQDTGIGMSRDDLIANLGTIARSGSKNFIKDLESKEANTKDLEHDIIGQFGVGFYSAFIVGDTIEVYSKPSASEDAHCWVSDGSGEFSVAKVNTFNLDRGTKIIIHLRPEYSQFARKEEVDKIIQKYSNFIGYPIYLNGERSNKVVALWAKSKSDIKEDDYRKFFEYISRSKIAFKYKLHLITDTPLVIKSILYIPSTHNERMGMGQEEMEVSLYSRKILIKEKCKEMLPSYLRFVKGVVDCEDLPLNISRENYQNSALVAKLNQVMTRRVIKLLLGNFYWSNGKRFYEEGRGSLYQVV
jgi:TNF receptor-associated protein 1